MDSYSSYRRSGIPLSTTVTCPKCGARLLAVKVDVEKENSAWVAFCPNPQCGAVSELLPQAGAELSHEVTINA